MNCGLHSLSILAVFHGKSLRRLSTSHLGSSSTIGFGFSPVEEDGYGIGYALRTDLMHFTVTGFDHPEVEPAALAETLRQTLRDMVDLSQPSLEEVEGAETPPDAA